MKRVITLLFAFLITASLTLVAQEPASKDQTANDKSVQKAEKKEANAAAKGKTMSLTGWVKDQDGKTVFINDKDKQAWNISNVDAVKGHEGHHVKVKAKLNESDHSMNVEKLTMMARASRPARSSKKKSNENKTQSITISSIWAEPEAPPLFLSSILLACVLPCPAPISSSSRSWMPPWLRRRAKAASGWFAAKAARSAATGRSPSASLTLRGCAKDSLILRRAIRSVRRRFVSARGNRGPGSNPTFPEIARPGFLPKIKTAEEQFAEYADDEPCPALDPKTGACDFYSARPMTCRTFGPPVRSGSEGALGVCELCYHGASDRQIAECEMVPDPDNLEEKLIWQVEKQSGKRGETIVAFCLAK